jgi:hypothetical protein
MIPAVTYSRIRTRILLVSLWLLLAACANIFAVWFVSKEQYIYFWDFAEYWHDTSLMVYMLRRAPLGAISKLLYSIRHYDYNYLPTIPLTIPMMLFGETRLIYILSIVNIYAIPAAYVLTAATTAIAKSARFPHLEILHFLVPFALLTLPAFWVPILRGYPDVGGVVLISGILFFYFRNQPKRLENGESIVCGVLLAALLLFRRWYGFWAVSFMVLLPLDAALALWDEPSINFRSFWKTYRPAALIVLSFCIVVAGIAWPLVLHMITTPYRDLYSAYRGSGSLLESSNEAAKFYVGAFVCSAFAVSVAVLVISRTLSRLALFLLAQLVLILALFERIQGLSWQHFYLFTPTIAIVLGLALAVIANAVSWFTAATYSLIAIMAFGPVFSLNRGPFAGFRDDIAPRGRCNPLIRHDLAELRRLLASLERYDSQTGGTVYVLASSGIINSALLWEANLSLDANYRVTGRILRTADVDRRDGFPLQLLNSEYVLVAVPIQYHLKPEAQHMIELPAEALLKRRNIGNAFEMLADSFLLDDHVKVYLFRRVRPITKAELGELEGECKRVYTDVPEICIPAEH